MTPTDCAVTQWASVGEPRRWLRQRLGFLFKSVELPSDVISITKRRFTALLRQQPLADALTRSTRTRLRAPFRETQPSIKRGSFCSLCTLHPEEGGALEGEAQEDGGRSLES